MKHFLTLILCLPLLSFAQKKEYPIKRTSTAPLIDGNSNEATWTTVNEANTFTEFYPNQGTTINQKYNTSWKATYDDKAIYFLVTMKDNQADSIMSQLCKRDEILGSNNDYIEIRINPYQDGQTDFSFSINPLGVQQDIKYTNQSSDKNWDMIWEGAANITSTGWQAEFKIPYSALRFPKAELQNWSVNVFRHIRRYRADYAWNPIDITLENKSLQAGAITGFKNIEPPIRLSMLPFLASSALTEGNTNSFTINGGLDLKYGLNESFTLDMTLVPDFGNVGFDNQVLNLSPFEVQYNEKRDFFIEGTELFDKSGLFYSRRISDDLINATKLTGKTKGNLGIGILNAITAENDKNPLSNYNILVLDQSIKGNSFVTLTNTIVNRGDGIYSSVTGLNIDLKNKKNTFNLDGGFNYSQIKSTEKTNGFSSFIRLAKNAGKFKFNFSNIIESDTYDPNDMGFLYNNNEFTNNANIYYQITKESNRLVNFNCSAELSYEQLYSPRLFSSFDIKLRQVSTFKNYLTWGLSTKIVPVEKKDYFEARTTIDDVFIRSESIKARTFFSSDYRKKLAIDFSFGGEIAPKYDTKTLFYRFSPRIRVSNQFFVYYVFSTSKTTNDVGFIDRGSDGNTIFSKRKKEFFTNVISGQYVLNTKMSFDLKFRHHWEQVENTTFHELDENGYLAISSFDQNKDINYNAWNIDLNFNYWFAPGSEISVVLKNAIYSEGSLLPTYYRNNLESLLDNPQENSISLRLRYYLDYVNFKKKD